MEFRTVVAINKSSFEIQPCEQMLFVGSCFAEKMGLRFQEERFRVVFNPYGVMYNPASVLHTVERIYATREKERIAMPSTVILSLGTNRVYILKETGEIVDNCQKQPQRLFEERELSVDECADYICRTINLLREWNPAVRVILTVSPIRYRKYGYHGSQLSKATLLLAVDKVIFNLLYSTSDVIYFPSYEIVLDELRDYRFFKEDMLHPSKLAGEYIWERFTECCFSEAAKQFLTEWKPIKDALNHQPFNPESEDYIQLMKRVKEKMAELKEKYPDFPM